jgi:hypothetical protein
MDAVRVCLMHIHTRNSLYMYARSCSVDIDVSTTTIQDCVHLRSSPVSTTSTHYTSVYDPHVGAP